MHAFAKLKLVFEFSGRHLCRMQHRGNSHATCGKKKVIPVTDYGGPYGCETSRLPHFLNNRLTNGGEVLSLTCQPAGRHLPPGRFLVLISVRG
jgi:hypothetical protein